MAFFVEYYLYILLLAVIISLVFFQMVRKGSMVYAEAWRNLFSLLMVPSALYLIYNDVNLMSGGFYTHIYNIAQIILLLPGTYLVMKFLLGPIYFSFSSLDAVKKLHRLYVQPGKIERFALQFISILSIMISALTFFELLDGYDSKMFLAALVLLLSGIVLLLIRNTLYSEILASVALSHMSGGDLEEANRLLQESLRYRKDLPRAWAFLTELHIKQKKWENAMRYLRFLKRIRSGSQLTGILEAKLEYAREKYANCVRASKRVLKKHPRLSEVCLYAGKSSIALEEYAQAISFFESYFENGENDPEALAMCVKAYFKTGDHKNVIQKFNMMDPEKIEPGLFEESRTYLEKARLNG